MPHPRPVFGALSPRISYDKAMSASITVHIIPAASPMRQGRCWFGHAWIELNDGARSRIYGFNPVHREWFDPRRFFTQGKVYTDDQHRYSPSPSYCRTWPLATVDHDRVCQWAEQALLAGTFGDYNILSRNCIRFMWEALEQAGLGLPERPGFRGSLWPWANCKLLDRVIGLPPAPLAPASASRLSL
jgi:hypothetical protein